MLSSLSLQCAALAADKKLQVKVLLLILIDPGLVLVF